jgi:leader peptidase (prepilin peptidase)/N-methyltransferase
MDAVTYVAFALLGLSVGSFLNLCIDRLPRGGSIMTPGSHCDACERALRPSDLIPVLSYLLLRGRCRYCGARIPIRVPVVELTTGLLYPLLVWHYGLSLEVAAALVYTSVFIAIFFIDLEHRLILIVVAVPAMVVALAFSFFWSGFEEFWPKIGPGFALSALLGAGVGSGLMAVPHVVTGGRGMGFGDVYLAALMGLVLGFPLVLVGLWVGIVAGGAVAIALLLSRAVKRKDAIPFGPFLVVGAMVALIWGDNIMGWWLGLGQG